MIFVTLGSQKFQFNRLLQEIDKLIENGIIEDEVFAQIGYSDYQPKNYKFKCFLDRDEFSNCINCSDVIITHGGTGVIINAVKKRKKVIAVPRLAKYGEHVDDHQLQLIKQFDQLHLIIPCYEMTRLYDAYATLDSVVLLEYKSNTNNYLKTIDDYFNEKR